MSTQYAYLDEPLKVVLKQWENYVTPWMRSPVRGDI